jgi:hypothetical protein
MWVLAEYQPTTLFSLRPATATTSGGKSLIVPTPFAIKMALLDAAIRTQGLAAGRALFVPIRDLRMAMLPPEQIAVNSTFAKILRLKEIKTPASEKAAAIAQAQVNRQWPFQKTIAYREYVQYAGPLWLAFQGMNLAELLPLLIQVNYLGKRGGFMQLGRAPEVVEQLPKGFTEVTAGVTDSFPLGTLQIMDDFGPAITFEHANIYSDKAIKLGKERVLRHVVLPYRPIRSSRSFTLYERFEA